ncbi:phage tail tape measure protein [Staphylococcus hominis]|uniref:phage tail tape measure protein n=1 Tax=Staphylococcus hominis TaxID=1290 RepID=UPI00287B3955|nr:phage tail tape measure protein [Staphylococcus hominis]MDS3874891.1 phage tail tape measure protein [Staphylococcus hominis]
MAESRFKGLSILMNMRDVGIERTMKQIRAQFKTLDSEMRRSNANFKHSEKNMQSYATRTKELTKAIDVTENSMKDISNQLKKMTLEEQRSSVEAEKLRQEYSKQHRALQMYQRQLNSTEQEMKQFGTTTKQTIFSMKKINDVLGTMKRQLNIANMAFQSTEKSTSSYKNYLNQLNTVIQKHQNTIRVLEGRYQKVAREQGVMSKEALELKEKILQEKATLGQLDNQYKKTTMEAKRFAFEQKTLTASMSEIRQKMSQVSQSLTISANKFKMSGQTAQAYKARISELNNGMKQQQLIVQNLSRQYDFAKKQYGATSQEAQQLNVKLSEERLKLKELNTQLNQTTQAHNRLEMEQKQGISSMAQIRAKMSQFNDTLSLSRSNLARAGESVKAYGSHLNALKTNMSEQRVVLRELIAQYNHVATAQGRDSQEARELSSAITQQKIKMNELESELDQTTQSYKRLETEQRNAQRLASSGFGRSIQSVNKYKDSIRNVGSTMRSVGSTSMLYMTMPAVAGMGTAIKSSIEWEQALAGVAKTTNMSGSELNKMGNEITKMSNTMPFAATEIAGVAEAAGQLGIKKQDITSFTRTMMNLGVATNLTADEAATEFARFANAANMPIKDVDRLGSTVVALGNSTATTEKEIVEMAQRLAGAGAQAGFSSDEIMSVSAAMSSVGIEAEAGGTAMTQIWNKMTKAVAEGGDTLDSFAKTAGVSGKEFAQIWENNPSKALSMFVKGLGETEGGAKGVLKALDDVGIKGIREADTIRRMANNHQVLDKALKTGSEGWKENSALTNEANIRYETMGSKLKMLKNTFINFARTIGDAVAPIVSFLADKLTGLFEHLQGTSNATKIAIAAFTLLGVAIPPLIVATGVLAHSIVGISEAMTLLNATKGGAKFFSLFNGGIKGILPKIGQLLTKIPLLGSAFTLLTGPVGIVIGVIAALTAGIVYLWKTNDSFRNFVINAWNSIKNTATSVFGFLKVFIPGSFKFIKDMSIKFLVSLKNGFVTIVKSIVNAGKRNFNILKAFLSFLWLSIKNNTLKTWLSIKNGTINAMRSMYNGVKKIIANLKNFMIRSWQFIKNKVVSFAKSLASGVKKNFSNLYNFSRNIFGKLKNFAINIWKNIRNKVVSYAKSLYSGVKRIFSNLYNFSKNIFGKLKNFLSNIWKNIRNNTVKFAKSLYSGVRNTFSKLFNFTRSIFSKLRNWMSSTWRKIRNSTVDFSRSLYNGVKRSFSNLYNGTRNIFSKTKNFMSNTWRSIRNNTVNMAKNLWNSVRNVFNNMSNGLKNIIGKIKGHITGMVSAVKKSLNSLIGAVNWVGGKLGIDSKIPKLSTGTESTHTQSFITNGAINRPTLATVNDKGKGNGKGRNGHQELIQRKNGSLFAPKGRDVVVPLNKGDKVINGKTTQNLQTQGLIPKFSVGTSGDDVRKRMLKDAKKHKKHNHPTFDAGEMMAGQGGAGGAFKEAWKYVTDKTKNIGKGTKKTTKSLSDGAKKMINTSKDALGAAGTWAKEKAGDLLDFVGKPGKLLDKVLKEFGVDFSMVNGEIPKMLWDAMWKRLKEGVKSLFSGWLDDASEGDGDGRYIKYLNNITTRYSPNGPPPGYPFNWAHPGIDLPYIYEKVQTPLEGKVETRNTASGFGHHIIVRAKPYDAYFGHLSKWLVKNGQHVKPGDTIGISGNTGSSSGPHLHYEMNKHGFGSMTGHSIDPVKWLKSHNGSKGGGSKAANAWKPEIKQALKANGLPTTSAYVNAWIRQIQTESGGNAGAVQGNIGDINNRTGNLARGLLQVIPPTFAANKLPGHGNIMNGLDNAMAAINYAKKRYGRTGMLQVIGHGHGYATGGLIKNAGWYNIAEGGYPEWIIPTDPSRRNDAMKMLALAAQDIDKKSSTRGNKRPNSLPKPSGSNDNDVLLQMLQAQQQQIALLTQIVTSNQTIADKNFEPTIDKYTHEQQVFNSIDKYNRQKQRKSRFKPGEVT